MARQQPLIRKPLHHPPPQSSDMTPRSVTERLQFQDLPIVCSPTPPSKLTLDDIPDSTLADTLALVLDEFCHSRSQQLVVFPHPHDAAALFFSPSKQLTFTLNFYCARLIHYTSCSKSCFVVAILYLVRLAERCPVFQLNEYNVHRLFCTAVRLAAKWVDDVSYSNAHYAKVGGIQNAAEMSKLEEHMLRALDYRLFISKESFDDIENQIVLIASRST